MNTDRRAMLGLISAGMIFPAELVQAQSETSRIQREIDDAAARGKPWLAPSSKTVVSALRLPEGAHLIGVPGRSRLVVAGGAVSADKLRRITLEGLTIEGDGRTGDRNAGMLELRDINDLRMQDCVVERAGSNGVALQRCGGRISGSVFRDIRRAAVFALDSKGLALDANLVERCGENGLLIWRSQKGDDGTILRGNRIQDIRADAGGAGEYGNAIGLYRAGGVIAEGNVMRRVAYSAVRNNGGSNVTISNNNIAACGEAAVFVEFAFDGVVISANIIDGAMLGLSVANYADHQGRLSVISGNLLRNFRAGRHPGDGKHVGGQGLFVEGDAAITGNVIEGADRAGMQLGWGPSLRDITASGNTIRDCGNGIEISVAPGAGRAAIFGNTLASLRKQGIVGMQWHKQLTGDLAVSGAKEWPMIHLGDNLVR